MPSTPVQVKSSIGVEGSFQTDTAPGIIRIPTPPTHNTTHISHHAPSFKSVSTRLQDSVDVLSNCLKDVMASRGKSRYLDVQVLLLSWKNDDLDVMAELAELGAMFTQTYHYHIDYYEIPDEMPGIRLQERLLNLVGEFAKTENLLVVCYAGHAIQNPFRSEPPIWVARRTASARLPSSIVQSILAECQSDALLLYDCCHAAPTDPGVNGQGVMEVLSACGFEGIAAEVGKDSFTNALIDELGACWRAPIAVNELHSRLIQRLRTYKPGIARDKFGKRIYNEDGTPRWELPRRKTPQYAILNNENKRRSIVLAPLLAASSCVDDLSSVLAGVSLGDKVLNGPPQKPSRYLYEDEDGRYNPEKEARVLLTIRVSTPELDIAAWKEWMRDLPPDGTGIKIDSVYGSFSTLIILTMPVTVWDLLPDDSAYSFIGFVTTENLVPELRSQEFWPEESTPQEQSDEESSIQTSEPDTIVDTSSWRLSAPTISQSIVSGYFSYNSSKAMWTCSECGDSGMLTAIDFCSNCSHLRCKACDIYRLRR